MFEKNLSMLPVVDNSELVGVLLKEDLSARILQFRNATPRPRQEMIQQLRVEDAMRADTFSVSPKDTIGAVSHILLEKKRSSLPVTYDGRFVGIISKTDLLKTLQ